MPAKNFKKGDKVKIDTSDNNKLTGYLADLQMDLADRTISSRAYDIITEALEVGSVFVVTDIEESFGDQSYLLKVGRTPLPFLVDDDDLISAIKAPTVCDKCGAEWEMGTRKPGETCGRSYSDAEALANKMQWYCKGTLRAKRPA